MERRDNYAIAAAQARQLFMNYDHRCLAQKLGTKLDDDYLYAVMLTEQYRIHRRTGDISRYADGSWVDANSFAESLTLLDFVCDSQENRCTTGRWRSLQDFGLQFHQNLLEVRRDPMAERFEANPEAFSAACRAYGGQPCPMGDVAFAFPIFEDLRVLLQLWLGDDEFPAQIRWLWDENAKMYLRYETMHYAIGWLLKKLEQKMVEQ